MVNNLEIVMMNLTVRRSLMMMNHQSHDEVDSHHRRRCGRQHVEGSPLRLQCLAGLMVVLGFGLDLDLELDLMVKVIPLLVSDLMKSLSIRTPIHQNSALHYYLGGYRSDDYEYDLGGGDDDDAVVAALVLDDDDHHEDDEDHHHHDRNSIPNRSGSGSSCSCSSCSCFLSSSYFASSHSL